MSIRIMTAVWEKANYGGNTLLTLLALADWADDTGTCWPSVSSVARKSRQSVRQAIRVLQDLESDGVVVIQRRTGANNRYKLTYDILSRLTNDKSDTTSDIHDSAIRNEPSLRSTVKSQILIEREERERRAKLTEATRRGLRDFDKHPREEWEEDESISA